MLKLESHLMKALLDQPESGMGYQRVEVDRVRGDLALGFVFNSELLVLDDEGAASMSPRVFGILSAGADSTAGRIRRLRVIQPGTRASVREGLRSGEAKDAPVEQTGVGQVFKRFSAYANDRRVRPDGSLLAGTYATTEEDARNVKTGRDAVARYALPNPEPASYEFTSKAHIGTAIQRGIVAPANGQPGGGVEVIFPKGTQSGTATGPRKIPD